MKKIILISLCSTLLTAQLWAGAEDASNELSLERLTALESRIEELERSMSSEPLALQPSWANTLYFQSVDGSVRVQIGMRVQKDFAFMSGDDDLVAEVGPLKDGTKFRRARFSIHGRLFDYGLFRTEYDFAGGSPIFRDAWVGIRDIPVVGTLRVGRMLEPYALEVLSPNGYLHFLERGYTAVFYPFWSDGAMINNTYGDELGTWAAGIFYRTNNAGDSTENSKYAATARVTMAPIYEQSGRRVLHMGASHSYRKPNNNEFVASARPGSHVAPVFLSTGTVPSDEVRLTGLELAAVLGSLMFQAEYHASDVDFLETEEFPHSGDGRFSGYYVTASYFLTGEHRRYNRGRGVFTRVIPNSNFRGEGSGLGAWEVAARYSELDLNDGPVEGGQIQNVTLGVSWYPNPNMRVIWGYVRADLKGVGKADIGQMRVQFDF